MRLSSVLFSCLSLSSLALAPMGCHREDQRPTQAMDNPPLFHTGWFVESLATQTLVVFVIRTAGSPFRSRPSPALLASVLAVVAIALALPCTAVGALLGFVPLPGGLLAAIAALTLTYLLLVQVVKRWFYRRHALL